MNAQRQKTYLQAALLLAAIGSAASARAESGWTRLAQIISPKPAAQQPATDAPPAAESVAVVQPAPGGAPAAVAPSSRSNMHPVAAAVPDEGQRVASLGQTAAVVPGTPAGDLTTYGSGSKEMNLGLESQDNGMELAGDLLKDPNILRLMGDKPRFRYNANGRQDPMLMPWVRNAAIFEELNAQAEEMIKTHQLDKAAALYQRILDMKDARYQAPTMAKLQALIEMQNEQAKAVMAAQTGASEPPAELPSWISDHTTAAMISKGQQMCMVGDHMLAVGDSVPDYPDVRVDSISDEKVLYKIKNQTFEVALTSR